VVMAAAGVDAKTAQAMLTGDNRLCIVSEARIRRVFGIPDALAAYLEGRHSVIFLPPEEVLEELYAPWLFIGGTVALLVAVVCHPGRHSCCGNGLSFTNNRITLTCRDLNLFM
jgi:hypothetical protein